MCGLALSGADKSSAISRMRIRKITEIIRRYQQAGENLSDPDVKAAIFQEVGEAFPAEPQGRPRQMSSTEISQTIREKVAERFPDDLRTIERKAMDDAAPIFTMHKILDYVSVGYEQGRRTFYVEGVFYGFGKSGHSINVGGRIIPLFDLLPEHRVKFDANYNRIQKQIFIQNRIRNYYQRKTQYSSELFVELRSQAVVENEKEGWIYAFNEWLTPREVASRIIQGIITQVDEPETPETPPFTPTTPTTPDQPPTQTQPSETTPSGSDSLQQQIAEAKRQAEQKKIIIANTFTGVDADQGYGLALWEMTHREVALLFQPDLKLDSETSIETITYPESKSAIESVQLFFMNQIFYKVTITFRIAHPEAMQLLWQRISENYGESKEEYAERERESIIRNAVEAIMQTFDKQPTPCDKRDPAEEHDYKDVTKGEGDAATVIGRVCSKCATVEPHEIPQESTFTWEGEITQAQLTVRLTADRSEYSYFAITKENRQLRLRLEAEIERERLRRAEEERRKREELYREPPPI